MGDYHKYNPYCSNAVSKRDIVNNVDIRELIPKIINQIQDILGQEKFSVEYSTTKL